MVTTRGGILDREGFERLVERMIERMNIDQKRLVFGVAFQGWKIGNWVWLIENFPTGQEFAA